MESQSYSVKQLNEIIKSIIDSEKIIHNICVFGEISNYKIYRSGHHYFTLKDSEASIRCVMYKYSASKLRFVPEDGMSAAVFGSISVYVADGGVQLVCTGIRPLGMGDLHFAFEQLKEKLFKEGLFDPSLKKPLPRFPQTVAVITSGDGAAVHDIIRISRSRWPLCSIKVFPVHVQGELAAPEISAAIDAVNRLDAADVIIVGRGGGSLEDLWAFNEEIVARAIFRSRIPVVSAVGHEPDITISDFVADVRASTPSNAAELCLPDINDVRQYLDSVTVKLESLAEKKINSLAEGLNELASRRVLKAPDEFVSIKTNQLDGVSKELLRAFENVLSKDSIVLASAASALDAMSPLKVLSRGYAYATKEGQALRSIGQVNEGDKLSVMLSDGTAVCSVDSVIPKENYYD